MNLPKPQNTIAEAVIHASVTLVYAFMNKRGGELQRGELRDTIRGLSYRFGIKSEPHLGVPGDHFAFEDGSYVAISDEFVGAYADPTAERVTAQWVEFPQARKADDCCDCFFCRTLRGM